MLIEASIGEVLDKISILAIKLNKIKDTDKLRNVAKEMTLLTEVVSEEMLQDELFTKLCGVNMRLWEVEDEIRERERDGDFDLGFISLARMVYHNNDERAAIKKEINIKYGSEIIEEKSYSSY